MSQTEHGEPIPALCSRHPAILYGFVLPESRGVLPWSQSFVLPHCQNLLFWQKVILWHSTLNSE
jgi:hypothetical protein